MVWCIRLQRGKKSLRVCVCARAIDRLWRRTEQYTCCCCCCEPLVEQHCTLSLSLWTCCCTHKTQALASDLDERTDGQDRTRLWFTTATPRRTNTKMKKADRTNANVNMHTISLRLKPWSFFDSSGQPTSQVQVQSAPLSAWCRRTQWGASSSKSVTNLSSSTDWLWISFSFFSFSLFSLRPAAKAFKVESRMENVFLPVQLSTSPFRFGSVSFFF